MKTVNVPFLIPQRAHKVPFLIIQGALKMPFFINVTVPFFVPVVNTTLEHSAILLTCIKR